MSACLSIVDKFASISAATSTYGIRARPAASITGVAVAANGPAQLITAAALASAWSSACGSSTAAGRTSTSPHFDASVSSVVASRPAMTVGRPRRSNSSTTKRPVCPVAP